jgi:cell division protein FtsN
MARVTRKKPAKRAPNTRNNKRNQSKQGFPFIASFVALLLIVFIAYFVFFVEKPSIKTKKNQTTVKEEVLPEKPQPQWDYVDALKTKEVKVDIPEENKPTRPYQMQCGSFRSKADAESLKAMIAFQGLESQVEKTGNWYRVILGPYDRKRIAEKDRHILQKAKIDGCQVWLWR